MTKSSPIRIAILAGGQSTRMGRDKSRLQLGTGSFLKHIREAARQTGVPVSTIRSDLIPGRGPLGGIFTALRRYRSDAILFLACDMPLVGTELIQWMLGHFQTRSRSLVTQFQGRIGFPAVFQRDTLPVVETLMEGKPASVRRLAEEVRAETVQPPDRFQRQFTNVNTPEEYRAIRSTWD